LIVAALPALALVHKAALTLTLCASCQLKSSLNDMKTGSGGASISACMGASRLDCT